jgi:hypothetical protein
MKLKCGDIKTKVSSNFTSIVWREKQNVNILDQHEVISVTSIEKL